MATHTSAAKRARQAPKRTERNRTIRSKVRTTVKNFLDYLAKSEDKAKTEAEFRRTASVIQKAVSKGVLHRNTAARKISRIAARVQQKVAKPRSLAAKSE